MKPHKQGIFQLAFILVLILLGVAFKSEAKLWGAPANWGNVYDVRYNPISGSVATPTGPNDDWYNYFMDANGFFQYISVHNG
jgi:hypothetical protein